MKKTVSQHQNDINSLFAWQQAILDSSEYGIISTDTKGLIATFNRTSEILLGYKAEEMIGIQTPAIIHDPDEVEEYAELLSKELGKKIEPGFETFVAKTRLGEIDNREWRYVRKDGSIFPVYLSVTAIRSAEQEIIGFLGTFFDLSERKKAEEELDNYRGHLERLVDERTSELKATQVDLAQAAEIAKLGHWRIDEVTNEYLTISVEYARIFGYTVEEFMNRYGSFEKDMDLKHPDDKEMVRRAHELREDIELDYRILRRDGEVRYVRETCKYILDESGNIIESVGTLQDITELKESQLQAEAANLEKSRFLSSISHELRTPMHHVLGFAQVLGYNPKEPLSEKQKSAVDHILRGGNHLLELIDRLLDLSKIEAGKLSLEIKHIPARDVIDECLYLIQTRAKQEDIKILDQTVGEDLPLLWTDKTRLTQVLLNLLSNAVKYNCENGTVTLGCQETPKQLLHISVADTGTGIPAEQRDDLFKPFERLGREAGQIEGTGIGLTISRQIIEQLGGEIGFESEEGKGSTFWVDIPLNSKQSSGSEEN